MTHSLIAVHQYMRRMAQHNGFGNDLQTLGDKLAGLVTVLAQVQGPHRLDRGVAERGDSPVAQAVHREKKLIPTSREPSSWVRASSPQEIWPPRLLSLSLSSPARAAPEMRSA